MLTFQEEAFSAVINEALPLLRRHWQEIALNKETVPLDPDWTKYGIVEKAGMLSVTTARHDGKLVGYACYILAGQNLHYRSVVDAESDIFWLAPEYRKGLAGVRLLKAAEAHLAAHGVTRIISRIKLHLDIGAVFERLGHKPIERVYAKFLEPVALQEAAE